MEPPDPAVAFRGKPPASILPGWYPELLASVTEHVSLSHRRAVAAANTELLAAYWAIGRAILERQYGECYGTKVIDRLSADLRERFPDARGYSPRNWKYMRAFAAAWPDGEVVQRGVAQLPWRHQIALIGKLDDPELRLWYAAAALDQGWSRDILALQIERRLHERSGKAISNFRHTLPEPDPDVASGPPATGTCSTSSPPPGPGSNAMWSRVSSSMPATSCWSSGEASRSWAARSGWSWGARSSTATSSSSTPSCAATS